MSYSQYLSTYICILISYINSLQVIVNIVIVKL